MNNIRFVAINRPELKVVKVFFVHKCYMFWALDMFCIFAKIDYFGHVSGACIAHIGLIQFSRSQKKYIQYNNV